MTLAIGLLIALVALVTALFVKWSHQGRIRGARGYSLENAPLPLLAVDRGGHIVAVNTALEELFGYEPGELKGQLLEVLVPAVARAHHVGLRRHYAQAPFHRPMANRILTGLRKNGTEVPIEIGLSPSLRRGEIIATVIDATEKQRRQDELLEANNFMTAIIHCAPYSIIATDTAGVITAVSPAAERMLWYSEDELINKQTPAIIHVSAEIERRATELTVELGEAVAPGFEVFVAKARRGITESREWTYVRKDGSTLPVELTVTALRNQRSQLIGFLGMAFDISERKRKDEYIHFLAHHDVLTGLPNRTLLQDRLAVAIERAHRFNERVGLMLVDLDHFKRINDSLGHHVGDQLLIEIAERLRSCVRTTDTVSRMGGDEFVILVTDITELAQLQRIAEKIVHDIGSPISVGHHRLRMTPSIGICMYPDDGVDAEALLRNADMAMYEAKANGRANVQVFSLGMASAATARMALEHELRQALDHGELFLMYQPVFDLRSARVVGIEALVRWQHPQRGVVMPGEFIPVAEDAGLIVPMGEWVLKTACAEVKALQQQSQQQLELAVNLSPRQLAQPNAVATIRAALAASGLDAGSLELEITENVLIEQPERTARQLQDIRALGVRIAIDDFGTGFSSLAYVTQFPIDRIKIDRSFIRNLGDDDNSRAVVNAILAMAQGLRIDVTAEGVEQIAQRDYLQQRGCAYAQGYLYSMPIRMAELSAFIALHARAVPAR